MMENTAKPTKAPRRFFRFGIATLLMMVTLFATLFANEVNRSRNRRMVEASFTRGVSDSVDYSPRFESLDPDGLVAKNMTRLFGSDWNESVRSLVISNDELNDRVFDSIAQFKHIEILGFRQVDLNEAQIAKLAKMKSLQWLYFLNCDVDHATIVSLRKSLPNAFVNGVAY